MFRFKVWTCGRSFITGFLVALVGIVQAPAVHAQSEGVQHIHEIFQPLLSSFNQLSAQFSRRIF